MGVAASSGARLFGRPTRSVRFVTDSPVSPQDLAATIYHALGIPLHTWYPAQDGRPIELVPEAGEKRREKRAGEKRTQLVFNRAASSFPAFSRLSFPASPPTASHGRISASSVRSSVVAVYRVSFAGGQGVTRMTFRKMAPRTSRPDRIMPGLPASAPQRITRRA